MHKSFKYRLWTNANQERELAIMLETHRRLYNECLEQRVNTFKEQSKAISYIDQSKWFTISRKQNPYYLRLNVHSAESTIKRLDLAYAAFFRRVRSGSGRAGFPRFNARGQFDSFSFRTYLDGCRIIGNKLKLQHIGEIRINLHRPIEGEIKTVAIKNECGKWYAIFACNLGDSPAPERSGPSVGIDVGLTSFLTTSEGDTIENPRYEKMELPKLRRLQRSLCRKKKGGSNRQKSRRKVAKLHARIANLRRDHHHKVALSLVRRYGWIATESLNIRGMLRNSRLARAISDAGWYSFQLILCSKAESAGCKVVKVNPCGTSQTCPCGERVPKKLSDRWHECPACGFSANRDHASALVILQRSLEDAQARTEPAGVNVNHRVKRPQKSRQRKLVK